MSSTSKSPLRFAIVSGVMILAACVLLAGNALRLLELDLIERGDAQVRELQLLFNASFPPALVARETAANALLREIREKQGLGFVLLLDRERRLVAEQGWGRDKPLPQTAANFSSMPPAAKLFHGSVTLRTGTREYAYVNFGIPTDFMREARLRLIWQSTAIGIVTLAVMLGLLFLSRRRSPEKQLGGDDEVMSRTLTTPTGQLEEYLETVRSSEARFRAIVDYSYGIEAWFNAQGRLIWISRSIERITGHTVPECLIDTDLIELLVSPQDRQRVREEALRARDGSSGENFELRLLHKDGSEIWIAADWQPIYDAEQAYLGLRVSAGEIRQRKKDELKILDTATELRRAQAMKSFYLTRSEEERRRLEALLDVMKIGVLFLDQGGRVIYANRAVRSMWHIPPSMNLTGSNSADLYQMTADLRAEPEAYYDYVKQALTQAKSISDPFEIRLTDKRTILVVSAPVPGIERGSVAGRVWIYEDITEQKRSAQQLIQLAERDPLTSLYNRRRFDEELERMLADAARRKTQLGLLMFDLDSFKPINDTYGHQAGDEMLVKLGQEVGSVVRRNEMFFRLGGDEFAILTPDSSETKIIGLAQRVSSKVAAMTLSFEGQESRVTASIGIAIYPQHASNSEEIISRADQAMYQAKSDGKNRWHLHRD